MALNLTAALLQLQGREGGRSNRHVKTLRKLSEIFGSAIELTVPEEHLPKQSSSTPTAPAQLRTTPRVHQKRTRANTPGMLPEAARRLPPIAEGGRRGTTEGGQAAPTEGGPHDRVPSEGEPVEIEGGYSSEAYYANPRPKRQRRDKVRAKPTRRSPRLNPAGDSPVGEVREEAEAPAKRQEENTAFKELEIEEPIVAKTNNSTPSTRAQLPSFRSPRIISQEAVNFVTTGVWNDPASTFLPRCFQPKMEEEATMLDMEHFCAPVVHPKTGEVITKYQKLANDPDPEIRDTWRNGLGKEFGGMAQGDKRTDTKGMDAIFVLTRAQIKAIPKHKTITYARLVVDYRPQKEDPNRARMTAGGNLIQYAGEVTTRTSDLSTAKILWNSVVSTSGAKFAAFDISNMYLHTPLAPEDYEYMRIPLDIFPEHTIDQYNLREHEKGGFVYVEIRRAIYGLPQAGALANKLLKERLAPFGYFEVRHTPGLFKHVWRPIAFSLVVDDFGIRYVGREHADHLANALKKHYPISEDWEGKLYCGISLSWDYENRILEYGMPGYIKKALQKYLHEKRKEQHAPYPTAPRKYGRAAQEPDPPNESPRVDEKTKTRVQQVVGTILYYARAVDLTLLPALSSLASEQARATERTVQNTEQMLDYLATNPEAKIRVYASDMILNIHSDASYMSEPGARSRAAGYFFLGWMPREGEPIRLNGAFFCLCTILKFVAASAAEAELGALFLNMREGRVFRLTLEELGHPQPPTPVHADNETAVGIVNGTIKRQRSRMFEMRYFYCCDQVDKGYFAVIWTPGLENLADYLSKHHAGVHHRTVRPIYLHCKNSPRVLQRAPTPKQRREQKLTVATLAGKYSAPTDIDTTARPQASNERKNVTPKLVATAFAQPMGSSTGLRGCVGSMVGWGGLPTKWVQPAYLLPGTDH